jgi:hypothetical protein
MYIQGMKSVLEIIADPSRRAIIYRLDPEPLREAHVRHLDRVSMDQRREQQGRNK